MRKTRILIADADASAASMLATYVARLGYEVTAAVSSGSDALDAAASEQPDLALIDLHMTGEVSGLELAKNLPGIPVVFMSVMPDHASLCVAKENGAYALLPKPFLAHDFRVAMRAALGRAAVEQVGS